MGAWVSSSGRTPLLSGTAKPTMLIRLPPPTGATAPSCRTRLRNGFCCGGAHRSLAEVRALDSHR